MGSECSKIKVCSVCHEPCETYVCTLKNAQPKVKLICCLLCAKGELDKISEEEQKKRVR